MCVLVLDTGVAGVLCVADPGAVGHLLGLEAGILEKPR